MATHVIINDELGLVFEHIGGLKGKATRVNVYTLDEWFEYQSRSKWACWWRKVKQHLTNTREEK
jgi:hypothetical protein